MSFHKFLSVDIGHTVSDRKLVAEDLKRIMQTRYPDVDDGAEHPMTAVGVVLLTAAILGIADAKRLAGFTRYPEPFISAIDFNMKNNQLWSAEGYDCSTWLLPDGRIKDREFWDHIRAACGELWFPAGDSRVSADTCMVYWGYEQKLRT